MSSDIRRVKWNSRERATSSDLNDATNLEHRALIEAMDHIVNSGDARKSGVLRGLEVDPPSGGGILTVEVQPGLALRISTAPTSFDSDVEWIELAAAESVDLAALVDGANPRWVIVFLTENDAIEASESRDVFNTTTGTFTPQTVEKVRGSEPTLGRRGGIASATPVLPAGVTGEIPLAYIYLEAAATGINSDDVIHCRPLLRAPGATHAYQLTEEPVPVDVKGGGISVTSDGLDVRILEMRGTFKEHAFPFRVPDQSFFGVTGDLFDGGAKPVADAVVYVYAIPANLLYPSGHDADLAKREFRPQGTTIAGARSRFNVLGSIGQLEDCWLVFSERPPSITKQGPPSTSSDFDVQDPAFGPTTLVDTDEGIYVGALDYDQAAQEFKAQSINGGTWVLPQTRLPGIAAIPENPPGPVLTQSIWDPDGALTGQFPITALRVKCVLAIEQAAGDMGTVIIDDACFYPAGVGSNNKLTYINSAAGVTNASEPIYLFPALGTGNVTVSWLDEGGFGFNFDPLLAAQAYEDAILVRR